MVNELLKFDCTQQHYEKTYFLIYAPNEDPDKSGQSKTLKVIHMPIIKTP